MTNTIYYDYHFSPDSSAIENVYYDENNQELYVEFVSSGTIAGYAGVKKNAFNNFSEAPSAGKFYAQHIKGWFLGINGDVTLVERPKVEAKEVARKNYTVIVNVEGELKFDLNSSTMETALEEVRGLLERSIVDGSYNVKTVTHHF